MLKKMGLRKMAVTTVSILLVGLIYLFPTKEEVKANETISYIEESDLTDVFLMDKNNFVSEVRVALNDDNLEEKLKQKLIVITNNTQNDKVPNGFKGIIPENTKVLSLTIEKDTCTVDFSKELLNISLVDEERMLEAIIYTLTSESPVKKVVIKVEGEILERLPNSNKLLPNILDRNYGINREYDINNLYNLTKTTIYYTAEDGGMTYYVPVTKVTNNDEEKIMVIVSELKSSLLYQSNLSSYLNAKTELKKYELEEEVMNLTFNDKIFDSIYDKNILEEVVYTIGKSTKENYDVNKVVFYVDDKQILTFE